jgi:hypothetical protein
MSTIEIDFSIDLVPRDALMTKTSYRMGMIGLKELKMQSLGSFFEEEEWNLEVVY